MDKADDWSEIDRALDLDKWIRNRLRQAGFFTFDQLCSEHTPESLAIVPRIGKKALQQIEQALINRNLKVESKDKTRNHERKPWAGRIDFTRFDLKFAEKNYKSLWKRNAILVICKHLCEHGIHPDDITKLLSRRPNRVWCSVDGDVDANRFEELSVQRAQLGGPVFNRDKWFCENCELVHFNGRTYALSNRWGGQPWHKAMEILVQTFSQFGIKFAPSTAPSVPHRAKHAAPASDGHRG
jgi:hypothetical protein